jgi:hypothetical protein
MIKANELRIGNWVADECEPYHFQVEQLRKYVGDSIWAFYRKGSIKAKEITPIPLTEEWLIRFGFEWSTIDKDYRLFPSAEIKIIADVIEGSACCMLYTRTIHTYYKPIYSPITYVHQLQNLYFALTQTELTLSKL